MAAPSLRARLDAGETVFTAWCSLPDSVTVGAVAASAFDAVTLDMQHGGHHEASVYAGVAAVAHETKPCLVRVPLARWDMVSRALDFGASAVIAPMINSVADARAFATAAKYPPVGQRSWGPTRGLSVHKGPPNQTYLETANTETMTFAMIETREALDVLDDILDVPGTDAVFVGPADFSIAWTGGETVNPSLEAMMGAVEEIARRASAKGKHAGVFVMNPMMAPRMIAMGYRLLAIGFDTHYIAAGAEALLEKARRGKAADAGY